MPISRSLSLAAWALLFAATACAPSPTTRESGGGSDVGSTKVVPGKRSSPVPRASIGAAPSDDSFNTTEPDPEASGGVVGASSKPGTGTSPGPVGSPTATPQTSQTPPPAGHMITIAGSGTAGYAEGSYVTAQFKDPSGVVVLANGNMVVADPGNNRIRIVRSSAVATLAGDGTAAQFSSPSGVAVGADGHIYVADTGNHRIRMIVVDEMGIATVTTLAGGSTSGSADGDGTAARFNAPEAVAVDDTTLYVADTGNHQIRSIDLAAATHPVLTIAGTGTAGRVDDKGAAAQFSGPRGVAADHAGHLLVADTGNHCIRRIDLSRGDFRVVTTIGNGTAGNAGGLAAGPVLRSPAGVALDSFNTVYVADTGNHRICRVAINGLISTVMGNGDPGNADGDRSTARLNFPIGLTFDDKGHLIVADSKGEKIRLLI